MCRRFDQKCKNSNLLFVVGYVPKLLGLYLDAVGLLRLSIIGNLPRNQWRWQETRDVLCFSIK